LNKTVYVEESIKVLEAIIMQADPVLTELASQVKEFDTMNKKSAAERDNDLLKRYGSAGFREQRSRLNISFSSEKDLMFLRKD